MRWLIAAGGTGGHIFPALSVSTVLRRQLPDAQVLFVGTRRGLESRAVPAHGFALRLIHASGLVGLGWQAKARTLLSLPLTVIQCLWVLSTFRPHLVLGMGGFAAGPMVLLAALLGHPSAIAEQNAVAGRTNRVLGRFADRVFLSFPESAGAFPDGKTRVTGNPVRPELLEAAQQASSVEWTADPDDEFHLLVFGGSQGARGINRIMIEALPAMRRFPFPIRVMHQARASEIAALRAVYEASGIPHEVIPFIEQMDRAYLWAHLVVCRAGATSLAEIALFQKPAILIPYPHATDDHQVLNARAFQSAGAASSYRETELKGARLAQIIEALATHPERLRQMGANAGELARPDAAEVIVDECMRLLARETGHG